ncbi:hypothetical protein J6O48_03350 [bacterium]|nr:hypothetical protein [bacterium]
MKTVTIYAVISSQGSYDDYCEYIEKCFTNKDEAYTFAKEVDMSHIYESVIPEEIIDEIDEHYWDYRDKEVKNFCEIHNIPNIEELQDCHLINRTEEQQKSVQQFCNELDEHYDDWCKEYLMTHYDGKYTANDYNKHIEYIDHKYDDWHDCMIKELELVVDDEFKI